MTANQLPRELQAALQLLRRVNNGGNPCPTNLTSAAQIVTRSGMASSPAYYSGRGVERSDCNGTHLLAIWYLISISTGLGVDPAANFVAMIRAMPTITATGFLRALYDLEQAGWEYVPTERSLGAVSGPAPEDDPVAAIFGMLSHLSRPKNPEADRMESTRIKNTFLIGAGEEPIKTESPFGSRYDCYYPQR